MTDASMNTGTKAMGFTLMSNELVIIIARVVSIMNI